MTTITEHVFLITKSVLGIIFLRKCSIEDKICIRGTQLTAEVMGSTVLFRGLSYAHVFKIVHKETQQCYKYYS